MRQFKLMAFGAVASALLVSAASAGTQDIRHRKDFFQNVKAEHVVPLLERSAYVFHADYSGAGQSGGTVVIAWHGESRRFLCVGYPGKNIPYRLMTSNYTGELYESKKRKINYPLLALNSKLEKKGYLLIRYDASTGWFSHYIYWNKKKSWAELGSGHLQSELPAVTWELCPDFPSAESLGATVNHKQTAKRYFDLVAQDAGRRVLKPEYEAMESTAQWLNYRGQVQDAEKLNDQLEAEGKAIRRTGSDR